MLGVPFGGVPMVRMIDYSIRGSILGFHIQGQYHLKARFWTRCTAILIDNPEKHMPLSCPCGHAHHLKKVHQFNFLQAVGYSRILIVWIILSFLF